MKSIDPIYSKKIQGDKPVAPIDSSTVILTRDANSGQFEILLMQRHFKQNFMGGAYVFPGGMKEDADCDKDLINHIYGLKPEDASLLLQETYLSDEIALGLFFTAIRETFEEARILLACTSSGRPLDFAEEEVTQRFNLYRQKLIQNELSLKELAEKEAILYTLDILIPYSHWITPEIESKRFNTRFFLARLPQGQKSFHDGQEMTNSIWITPDKALKQHKSGRIVLMPPTLKTIIELNNYDSTEQLYRSQKDRRIDIILPQAFVENNRRGVKLPHDPDYTIDTYKQPPRSGEPSRIVMIDGKWAAE